MGRKKTHEEYILECKEKDFDLPVDREDNRYNGNKIDLYYKCKILEHEEYPQTPIEHLRGYLLYIQICKNLKNLIKIYFN